MEVVDLKTGKVRKLTISEEIQHHVRVVLDLNGEIAKLSALRDGRKQRRLPIHRKSRDAALVELHRLVAELPKAPAK